MNTATANQVNSAGTRYGFSLVELLVVISIIGMLMSLLLPAIQGAREAARRLECKSNLKQIGLAWHAHHGVVGYFPSGGWGIAWVGDADRGLGAKQPGTWTYSILPFVEQSALFDLASDGKPDIVTPQQMAGAGKLVQTPLSLFHCSSRRDARLYPRTAHGSTLPQPTNGHSYNCSAVPTAGKLDYAANLGDVLMGWASPAPHDAFAGLGFHNGLPATGVCYQRSEVQTISDGASQTYMVVEKGLPVTRYTTGDYNNDSGTAFSSDDGDAFCYSIHQPVHDRHQGQSMGGAHSDGFNVVFCDGSVRTISYSIDLRAHQALSTRFGGEIATPP